MTNSHRYMTAPFSARDLLAAAAVMAIWGTNFVAIKIGLRTFTPFQLGAARYVFGIVPVIFLIPPPRIRVKWIVVYGLIQGVGQFGLLYLSLRVGMSAALASVVMQTQVFFTAVLSFAVLAEKPTPRQVAGMLLAAIGLTCLAIEYVHPNDNGTATTLAGFGICLAAALLWGASNVIVRLAQRSSPGFDPLAFVVWANAIPILPFIGMSIALDSSAERHAWLNTDWLGWLAVAYIGWGASLVAYAMWTNLLKKHGANRVAPFSLLMPPIGLASGMLLLGDRITPLQWAGTTFMVLALACVVLAPGYHQRSDRAS